MGALQYVDIPGYNALILRRTFPELDKPEALLTRSHEWLDNTDVEYISGKHQWTFPSGATLTFGHMANESDKNKYQGGAYQYIGWDELTGFLESQYRYLFGWLRKLQGVNIPLRVRSASNPGNVGHEWVKARFVDPRCIERPFIPALISDNPAIDQADYIESLIEMTPVDRERIMNGNWDVLPDGVAFKLEWFVAPGVITDTPPEVTRKCRVWDLAATVKTSADYTVGGLYGRSGDKMVAMDIVRGKWEYPDVRRIIIKTANMDGYGTPIGIEDAFLQKIVGQDIRNEIEHLGYTVVDVPTRGQGDKFTRSLPVQRKAQTGNLIIAKADWNKRYIDEFCVFSGDGKTHDDQVDTASMGFFLLFPTEKKRVVLPIIPGGGR